MMTGNPYTVSVRTPEILDRLEVHPIWRQRAAEKAGQGLASWSAPASRVPPRIMAPVPIVHSEAGIAPDGAITILGDA